MRSAYMIEYTIMMHPRKLPTAIAIMMPSGRPATHVRTSEMLHTVRTRVRVRTFTAVPGDFSTLTAATVVFCADASSVRPPDRAFPSATLSASSAVICLASARAPECVSNDWRTGARATKATVSVSVLLSASGGVCGSGVATLKESCSARANASRVCDGEGDCDGVCDAVGDGDVSPRSSASCASSADCSLPSVLSSLSGERSVTLPVAALRYDVKRTTSGEILSTAAMPERSPNATPRVLSASADAGVRSSTNAAAGCFTVFFPVRPRDGDGVDEEDDVIDGVRELDGVCVRVFVELLERDDESLAAELAVAVCVSVRVPVAVALADATATPVTLPDVSALALTLEVTLDEAVWEEDAVAERDPRALVDTRALAV